MSKRHKLHVVAWGAAFANVLRLGYPFDNLVSGEEPRDGYETAVAPSGVEDAWDTGVHYVLEGDARWIPMVDTAVPVATGWDGATGVRAFLRWAAMQRNPVRLYEDYATYLAAGAYVECYVVEPARALAELETDGTRRIRLKFRTAAAPFTGY